MGEEVNHTIRAMITDGWTTNEIARMLRIPTWVVGVVSQGWSHRDDPHPQRTRRVRHKSTPPGLGG